MLNPQYFSFPGHFEQRTIAGSHTWAHPQRWCDVCRWCKWGFNGQHMYMYVYIYMYIYICIYIIYIYICIELRKFSVMTTMQLPSLLCFSVGAARLGRLFISIYGTCLWFAGQTIFNVTPTILYVWRGASGLELGMLGFFCFGWSRGEHLSTSADHIRRTLW